MSGKRRTVVSVNELRQLSNGDHEPGWAGYWYHRRLAARRLQPVCQIDYRRTARVSMTDYGPIRLTIDADAQAQAVKNVAFIDAKGRPLLEQHAIVEMKYRYQMPVLFKLLIEEFTLSARAISKYRLAALTLGLASIPDSGSGEVNPNLIYA